jgi:hypothetical protein
MPKESGTPPPKLPQFVFAASGDMCIVTKNITAWNMPISTINLDARLMKTSGSLKEGSIALLLYLERTTDAFSNNPTIEALVLAGDVLGWIPYKYLKVA